MKATTKRSKRNAVSSSAKSKKSTGAASISAGANSDRENAKATQSDGDCGNGKPALLAGKGSSDVLATAGNDNAAGGDVVHDKRAKLKSVTDRVFEGEGLKPSPQFEEKYTSNFGKTHKAEANGQLNLLECEEDNNEPPEPDDYVYLEDFKKDWDAWTGAQFDEAGEQLGQITAEEIWNQSNDGKQFSEQLNTGNQQLKGIKSKCECLRDVRESEPDLSLPASSLEDLNSANSLNGTNTVNPSSNLDIPESQFTEISAALQESQDNTISAAFLLPVNPSALMASDLEPTIQEIASPQLSEQLNNSDQNSQLLRTSLDFSLAQNDQEQSDCISLESLSSFPKGGTYANGNLSHQPILPPPGIAKDCLSLPSPGALSHNGKGRPPGANKLDRQLKTLGLIAPGEVASTEFLEEGFGLPQGYSNPAETRTALELAQDCKSELPAETESTASAAAPSEIALIGESQQLPSDELSTLVASSTELNLGSLNKEELLKKAIGQHHAITSIEREEFNLALIKLQRVRVAGLCFQEFKRRCGHGEFESSLVSAGIRTRTAQDYMLIAKNWQLIEAKARSIADLEQYCHLGLNWGLETIRNEKKLLKSAAVPPSDPDNWRTPDTVEQPILFLVKQVLGIITLDPCADDKKSVPALIHYTKADDGLSKDWEGFVFLFPPPSNPLPWIQKLCFFRARGDVKGAISLLKSDCLNNNQGMGELIKKYAAAICNWRGRIPFLNEDGEPVKGAELDWVFVYFGIQTQKFEENFLHWGTVSWINENQSSLTANNQQPTSFTNIKQEEIAAAKQLGLSNGKTIFPDTRDSDREIHEIHDPNFVPTFFTTEQEIGEAENIDVEPLKVNGDPLSDYMIAVSSNAAKFANHQSAHIIKSLLKVNFPNRVKEMLARLSEQEIKSLVMLCDEELDNRRE